MKYYRNILDPSSIVYLRNEVEMLTEFQGNYWLGIHDEPENTVEKYIQDSFDFYLSDEYPKVIGFEWWFHIMDSSTQMIALHASHDEHHRMRTAEMRYPSCTTTTFLNNHLNPSVIMDSYVGKHENELRDFPPTEAVYTVPVEGSFLTHKPYYIHGVFPSDDIPRVTLEYDVWEEQPENRRRLGIKSSIVDCHFLKQPVSKPMLWLGQTTSLTSTVPSTRVSLKRPTYFNEGDFWRVVQ